MNEQPYDKEHLEEYTGILTSPDARSHTFKMELKAEDNPVFERWTEKNETTIELEFRHNLRPSTMFFHNMQTCPNNLQRVDCNECKSIRKIYDIFVENLYHLQFGDTFKIRAALINNDKSVLPAEIRNFENYQPLLVACAESRLRLPDTPEGINKKYALEQQRLQREHEEEERRKEEERKAEEETKRLKKLHEEPFFNKLLDKLSPYFPGWLVKGVIVTVIGTFIGGTILLMFGESIKKIIFTIF